MKKPFGRTRHTRSRETQRRKRTARSYRHRLALEMLEDRRMLAVLGSTLPCDHLSGPETGSSQLEARLGAEQIGGDGLVSAQSSSQDAPFQNPGQRFDVNRDLLVSAEDALRVINFLSLNGFDYPLPEVNHSDEFPDVNGSDHVSALDALLIINRLGPGSAVLLAARLSNDSAPENAQNLDFITSQYDLEVGITYGDGTEQLEVRVDGAGNDPFTPVGIFSGTDPLSLSEDELNTIAGGSLADGDHLFEIRVDGSSDVEDFVVTVKKMPPEVEFDLDPDTDTDPDGDQITLEMTVNLVGMTEPNIAIELVETGATTTSDAAGAFRFDNVELVDGENTFTTIATDVAGNVGQRQRTFRLGDPFPPVVSAALSNDTGQNDSDGITSDPTVSGSINELGAVTSFLASFDISPLDGFFDVTADLQGGSFSFDRARLEEINGGALTDGPYTLRLAARDDSANLSDLFELPFTLDTSLPTASPDLAALAVGPAPSIGVVFDGAVDDTALVPANYTVQSTDTAGLSPAVVASVDRLSASSVQLNFDTPLDDGRSYELAVDAGILDLAGNASEQEVFPFDIVESFRLTQVTPAAGEEMVSVAREAIFRFSEQVDPLTVTPDSIQITSLGVQVPGQYMVSTTGRFVTFFPDAPLNPSTVVRMEIDGDQILAADGDPLDADGNGISGGMYRADFRTLPLTRIEGTNVFGFIRDSFTGDPIVGATVRVDAFPAANAVTDANGRFELQNMPAPDFFVHFDGSTATNAPAGTVYPNVGKPLHSVPGQTAQIEMDLQPFDVFLPPMALADIQSLSPTDPTDVGFGDAGKANLVQLFPSIDPAVWDRTKVRFEPNAAIDPLGNPATEAAIIPVPPDRIPAPLPPFLDPQLVISIQAGGATNFDIPAPITFPNLEGLAPGEQALIFSFNHDAGRWDVVGTGTVSADGLMLESDPGVGIVAPGWHAVQPGTTHTEDVQEPKPGLMDVLAAGGELLQQTFALALNGLAAVVATIDTAAPVFGQFPLVDQVLSAISGGLGFLADIVDDGEISGSTIIAVDLTLIGMLNPDPISGTVIDGVGLGLTLDSIGQNTIKVAQAGNELLEILQDTADWEIGLDFLSDKALAIAENFNLLSAGVEDIRAVHDATGSQPTSDPDLIEQYLAGLDKLERASAFFQEQPGGNISGAYNFVRAGYNTFLRQFGEVFDDRLDPAAGRPYDIALEDGTPLLRGVTDLAGNINAVIPPNERIVIRVALPLIGGVMTRVVSTGASGSSSTGQTFLFPTDGDDADGDRLFDEVEEVLGTSVGQPDSDGDVINDRAEVEQGLNPLDGRAFPTGIIASIPLLGEAQTAFVAGGRAYVSGGALGVSILDVSEFNNPIVIGQFSLPGTTTDVVADPLRGIAAVASNLGGLHLVDVSDPVRPTLLSTLDIAASRLELLDGVVYATVGDALVSVDLLTGEIVNTVPLGGTTLTDVAREGRMLYTMDTGLRLRAVETSGFDLMPKDGLVLPQGGGQLFVGNGVAYAAAIESYDRGGFARADVSDPDNLTLIGGSGVVAPFLAPGKAIVDNGSELGVLVGTAGTVHLLNLMDLTQPDPTINDAVVGQFLLPAAPNDVTVASGLAFVANGTAGLQVVNYRPFDSLGVPPTVSITSPADDLDLGTPGIQVAEGSTISVDAVVTDDVQVRKVELLVNGEVVGSDVTFPWDLSALALSDDGTDMVTLQARATDTGGNESLSNELMFDLIPDVDPPTIETIAPADGAGLLEGLRAVRIRFSESMNDETINANTIRLLDETLTPVPPLDIRLREDDRFVQLTYAPLASGEYQIVIDGTAVTDRAGVPLGGGDIISGFSLFEPIGGNTLFPGPLYPAGADPQYFSAGDLDFDGDQDLIAVNQSIQALFVILNNGDGSFAKPVEYATDIGNPFAVPIDVVVTDATNDGDLDAVVLYRQPAGVTTLASIGVFPGQGDGTLGTETIYDAGFRPRRITTGKINNDDVPDVLVTGETGANVMINNGTGGFTITSELGGPPSKPVMQAVLGDVNNDNVTDIVMANQDFFPGDAAVSLFVGNGDGTFGARTDFSIGGFSSSAVALDDFNDDDNLDIVVAVQNRDFVSVLLGNGNATFPAAVTYELSGFPKSVSTGDVNNDGVADLIAAVERADAVEFLLGNGDGTFGAAVEAGFVYDPDFLVTGHFNRDNNLDVITNVPALVGLYPLLGNGDGTFANLAAPPLPLRLDDVALVKIDDDDLLDLVTRSSTGIEVRLSNPDGSFALPTNLGFARQFVTGDLDGDNDPDLVVSNTVFNASRPRTISVFLNDGTGIWTPLPSFSVRPGDGQLRLGRMDADDHLDLVFASGNSGGTSPDHVVIHPGNGDGTFAVESEAVLLSNNRFVSKIELSDVNNDDKLDVAVVLRSDRTVAILEGNGDGTLGNRSDVTFDRDVNGEIELADLDGDDRVDLVVTGVAPFIANAGGAATVLLGNGDSTFGAQTHYRAGPDTRPLAIEDINNDNILDIVVINSPSTAGSLSVLVGVGDGTFEEQKSFLVGASPRSLAVGDLNSDGWKDVIVANFNDVSIVLQNNPD